VLLKSCAMRLCRNASSWVGGRGQAPKLRYVLSSSLGAVWVGMMVKFWILLESGKGQNKVLSKAACLGWR